jgi:hypothetical protein
MPRYRPRDDVPDSILDAYPGSVWVNWPHPQRGPWLIRLDWTRIDGRLECCGLEIRSKRENRDEGWPPELPAWNENPEVLTATILRKLRFGALLQDIREDGWQRTEEDARWFESIAADIGGIELAAHMRREAARDSGRRRRRGIPPLSEVAAVHRDASNRQHHPTLAVADHWHVAHSTAAKWVMRARAEGYLPPARRTAAPSRKRKGRQ